MTPQSTHYRYISRPGPRDAREGARKTTSHRDSVVEATTMVGLSRENGGFTEQNCDLTHKSSVLSSQNGDFGWMRLLGIKEIEFN